MSVMPDHNHAVALRCAEVGINVFPCDSQKRPLVKWRAVSTTSAAQISAFWNTWRDALVGIDLAKCGLVVFDADRHSNGADGVTAFAALLRGHGTYLAPVPIVHTPNNGFHFYFSQPAQPLGNREGDLPQGVNVRGCGGFVIAPFCLRPEGKSYRNVAGHPTLLDALQAGTIPMVPNWLIEIVRKRALPTPEERHYTPIPRPIRVARHTASKRKHAWALTALQFCIADLSNCPPGRRNSTLNAVAYRLGRIVARGWLERAEVERRLQAAAEFCGLLAQDGAYSVAATIRSGLNAGLQNPVPELR